MHSTISTQILYYTMWNETLNTSWRQCVQQPKKQMSGRS